MKFHNGCWLLKEGYASFAPQQVYEIRKEEYAVELCAPTRKIINKGNTLDGINLTLRITAPMEEMIRVQTIHHKGVRKKTPEFPLNLPAPKPLKTREDGRYLTITSGSLSLVIDKDDWSMEYRRDKTLLTKSGKGDLAYIKTDWTGLPYDVGKEDSAYMRQQLRLSVGELVYGLGERFTAFVKNGQSVSIWNEDGGTSTEQSYKNIPFYLSNRGYGVFVNHPEKTEFEIGTEQVAKAAFSVQGESLDYFVIHGPTMKQVLMRYTDLTGKPPRLAPWTYGLWLSTSFTTDYDEKTVMSFIDGMEERGIPLSVFHFDCCWMREYHWTDFVWDERVFPDPVGMLKRIKEKGIRVCVWINPYIGQESVLFTEGMEKGYFLKKKNGDVWQWDMWQSGLAVVDFTNPEARSWYQGKLEMLMDMGVDCFKTDFGERIPTNVTYFDHSDPHKMHNFYTYLYNQAVYEVLERRRGKEEAVLFARSATAGGQKFPVHWGGDCWSDYESMEESLRGGLSLTSSGFGYWSHDIGGFESQSTPDVYKRWAAFGLLSTHSRLHGSTSYRVPWVYDQEAVEVVRFFTRLKLELLPYLYGEGVKTSVTGIPMIRSMAMEFEDDRNCSYLDKQYMLGDSLLAAPVFNEEGIAEYYLPKGTWTHYLTGETAQGGVWRREHQDYCSIPLWVRAGSVIPTAPGCERADYSFLDRLEWRVYTGEEPVHGTVYREGKKVQTISVEMTDNGMTLQASDFEENTFVRLVNCSAAKAEGGTFETDGKDCLVRMNGCCRIQKGEK
ncbi:MAG: alpha-xylosidase [Hungatella sp.]|nr:alpha-xylosidase [Hungatella sp.]